MPSNPDRYSAHGSHMIGNSLRVYHQGGLDTYCGFYAILNLVNFLKFKIDPSQQDFIGAAGLKREPFEAFRRLIASGGFRGFFPETPFGDYGIEAPMLVEALSRTLLKFNLPGKLTIEEDQLRDPYDEDNQKNYFRPGTEKPFAPGKLESVLGLAAVKEDKNDDLGHWVVFIGKEHLQKTGIDCKDGWRGILLDSQRGYKFWRVDFHKKLSRVSLYVSRDGKEEEKQVEALAK